MIWGIRRRYCCSRSAQCSSPCSSTEPCGGPLCLASLLSQRALPSAQDVFIDLPGPLVVPEGPEVAGEVVCDPQGLRVVLAEQFAAPAQDVLVDLQCLFKDCKSLFVAPETTQ